ncbi:alpha/beta hydrolase family protein [Alicyclobacillus ferrooxydans]|uniref:alpha/beta hydrolase family protein n=1 Tax=Alicyclobacillus ferrooxydans TaxID=471514 RepID=UPI0006D5B562|nr:alpha/beta hydrolase [Alicyclobacillus ferrooxydans]
MSDEKIVLGAETNYPLNGRLAIPDGTKELLPAVVLVHGSGPSNMDEKVGNITPFKDLAQGLSQKGIAVLRYDKSTNHREETDCKAIIEISYHLQPDGRRSKVRPGLG